MTDHLTAEIARLEAEAERAAQAVAVAAEELERANAIPEDAPPADGEPPRVRRAIAVADAQRIYDARVADHAKAVEGIELVQARHAAEAGE
jgi:hypothetical protein